MNLKELAPKKGRVNPPSALNFLVQQIYGKGFDAWPTIPLKGMSDLTYQGIGVPKLYSEITVNAQREQAQHEKKYERGFLVSELLNPAPGGFPITLIGCVSLLLSLRQPPTDITLIKARQEAVAELVRCPDLKGVLERFIESVVTQDLLKEDFQPPINNFRGCIYRAYDERSERQFFRSVFHIYPKDDCIAPIALREVYGHYNWLDRIYTASYKYLHHLNNPPKANPESAYLNQIMADIKEFQQDKLSRMVKREPADHQEVKEPTKLFSKYLSHFSVILRERFYEWFKIRPLRNAALRSERLARAIEAVGKIDELLALAQYAENLIPPVVLPTILESPVHFFRGKQVRNPVMATFFSHESHYWDFHAQNWADSDPDRSKKAPNDFDFRGVSVITGPNSGGKSFDARTILLTQLLAQIGSFVPSLSLELSPADRLGYCYPINNKMRDPEGRFGTEMQIVSEEWKNSSPRSLIIFDELLHATTDKERRSTSLLISRGFSAKGTTMILMTHDFALANQLESLDLAILYQKEFKDGKPTFKLIPGICKDSRSERILRKYGLSEEALVAYLARFGRQLPAWGVKK